MAPSRGPTDVASADVAGRLLMLRPGTYSLARLVLAMSAELGCDASAQLHQAMAVGYLRAVATSIVDSDGDPVDDTLVRVEPAAILADGVPLPGAPGFEVEPLPSELVIPAVPPSRGPGAGPGR